MAKKFPKDEFDLAQGVGGFHRARRKVSDRLFAAVKYVAATAVLSASGILALNLMSQSAKFTGNIEGNTQTGTTVVTETFKADGVGVAVVDATGKTGAAMKVAQQILDAGWNVYGASNAVFGEPNKTVVYVNNDSVKDAAATLLKTIGDYPVKVSGVYTDPITVIVGKDFK